jgi:hypothetical protein
MPLANRPPTARAEPAPHLNLAWRHMIGGAPAGHENRAVAAIGYSHPVGRNTTRLPGFVREEERRHGPEPDLIETAARHRVAEDVSLGAGIGFIAGESPDGRIILAILRAFRLFRVPPRSGGIDGASRI